MKAASCMLPLVLLLPFLLRAAPGGIDPSIDQALSVVSDSVKDSLRTCLEDAGDNSGELAGALINAGPDQIENVVWLIMNMDHLDRLEMTGKTLFEHVAYADSAKKAFVYAVPQDMFRDYVLAYRISREPVSAYRQEFFRYFGPKVVACKTPADAGRVINKWICKNVKVIPTRVFGPNEPPSLTFRSRHGTDEEVSILTIAILKAIGIPSRPATLEYFGSEPGGTSWVETYSLGRWLPMYPFHPEMFGDFSFPEKKHRHNVTDVTSLSGFQIAHITSSYSETGHLVLRFFDRGRVAAEFEHAAVNVWNEGALRPLDYLDWEKLDGGKEGVMCEIGEGTYVVTAGIRDHTGSPFVMMREVAVSPGETTLADFDVSPRSYIDTTGPVITEEGGRIPSFTLPTLAGEMLSESEVMSERPAVFVLFNQNYEPSVRTVTALYEAFGPEKGKGVALVFISEGESDILKIKSFMQDISAEVSTLIDSGFLLAKKFGVEDPSQLPVVLFTHRDGTIGILAKCHGADICERIKAKLREMGASSGSPR